VSCSKITVLGETPVPLNVLPILKYPLAATALKVVPVIVEVVQEVVLTVTPV
jgi:hypothetical protein